jgi:hypothetical protein
MCHEQSRILTLICMFWRLFYRYQHENFEVCIQ